MNRITRFLCCCVVLIICMQSFSVFAAPVQVQDSDPIGFDIFKSRAKKVSSNDTKLEL